MAERAQILIRAKDETAAAFSSVQGHFKGVHDTLRTLAPQIAAALSVGGIIAFAKSAIDAGDAMNDMSQKTGLSVESLSRWRFVAEQSNATLESIQPGLKGLALNMESAARGSKESADAFQRLGVPVKDGAGNLRAMDAVMLDLAGKFATMPDGAQKSALAMRVFGKAGLEMIPILNQGSAGIAAQMALAEKLGLVMSTEAAAAADELNDSLNLVKQSGTALMTEFLNQAAPAISQVARAMAEAARDGGLFAAAIRGYGEAWKVLLFGADPSQMEQQREFIRGLTKEIEVLQKTIPIQEKAGVLGRLSGGDPVEMKRKLDALILTLNSARVAMRLMEEQANKPIKTGGAVVTPAGELGGDPEKARRAAESLAKELRALKNESDELWTKDRDNTMAAMELHRKADLERAQSLQSLIDESDALFNRDRDQTIARNEAITQAEAAKFQALKQGLMTENELRKFAYEEDMNGLNKALDDKLISLENYYTLIGRLIKNNEKERARIENQGWYERQKFAALSMQAQTKDVFGYLANITAGVSQHNRALFEINKVAGIANAIINAYEGISLTLSKYEYPLNIALAAAHGLAAFAQVSAIASTTFGAGSGAPSLAGGTAAPPVTPIGGGVPGAGSGSGTTTIINLNGDKFDRKQVKDLIEKINEMTKDGGRVVLA
jgi:hypothetical protein